MQRAQRFAGLAIRIETGRACQRFVGQHHRVTPEGRIEGGNALEHVLRHRNAGLCAAFQCAAGFGKGLIMHDCASLEGQASNILPGFNNPLGSNAFFIVRISSISAAERAMPR